MQRSRSSDKLKSLIGTELELSPKVGKTFGELIEEAKQDLETLKYGLGLVICYRDESIADWIVRLIAEIEVMSEMPRDAVVPYRAHADPYSKDLSAFMKFQKELADAMDLQVEEIISLRRKEILKEFWRDR